MNTTETLCRDLLDVVTLCLSGMIVDERFGRVRLAIRHLETCHDRAPPEVRPMIRIRVLDYRWDLAHREGKPDEAIAACEEGMRMTRPATIEHYGFVAGIVRILLDGGRHAEAAECVAANGRSFLGERLSHDPIRGLLRMMLEVPSETLDELTALDDVLREYATQTAALNPDEFTALRRQGLARCIEAIIALAGQR